MIFCVRYQGKLPVLQSYKRILPQVRYNKNYNSTNTTVLLLNFPSPFTIEEMFGMNEAASTGFRANEQ